VRQRSKSPIARRSRSRTKSRSRSVSREFGRRRGRRNSSSGRSPMSSRKRHLGNRDNPTKCNVLGIFGLSLHTTTRDLEKEFSRFGPLERCCVVLDGKSGQSRGFAFITYETGDDATAARNAMTDTVLDGRKIRVDYSITKRAHTPTPGMYMGRDERRPVRRTPSPRRRSPIPYPRRGRSPSPRRYRRSPSPRGRYRSPSPRYRRSRSPLYRRRSPSPRRDYRR